MNVANWATKQGIKYPIKLQQEGMQVWGATLPKPTPKTPPITVEKWAIGMWTPKANNTPVIPPKATVAPSVSAPKKWMPKLWKETLEQNITQWDDLIQEAKKYRSWQDMDNQMPYTIRNKLSDQWIYSRKHIEDFYNLAKSEKIMYRWQTTKWKDISYNNTKFVWDTDWWVFFSPDKQDALKYWSNIIELKSNKWNTVSIAESNKLQKMAQEKVALALKNKSKISDIIEQMALWRPKSFAKYTNKQFVETWDKFWQKWEMIYFKDIQ